MKLRYLLLFLCFISCFSISWAQIVYTEPAFPTVNDAVTIFFDATQGTAGLKDCSCDVYIHTGVITDASTSDSDWKHVQTQWGIANPSWKLTPVDGEDNLYSFSISPSIKTYYGLGDNEVVEKLAMVFRNSNGSLEGKDSGGKDIFSTVYSDNIPFAISLLSPSQGTLFKALGEMINIRVETSEEATITVFQEGQQVTQTMGTQLDYDLSIQETGTKLVEIIAGNGTLEDTVSFVYTVPEMLPDENPSYNLEPGIAFVDGDTKLRLALYAPNKQHVFVVGDFNDWIPSAAFQMKRATDGATYWIEIDGLIPGEVYAFQYIVDGTIRIADPYSTVVLDPSNDPFITALTYPDLSPYPEEAEGIVTLLEPGAPEYPWEVENFERPAKEELVIYELLVRDFIFRHNYQTLIDSLDYLSNLGVNAIELMPVNEFEGNLSWGYNPSFHMALDKYYGSVNEFKRFVDSCHARGIAVILDVVYNHAFSQSPLAQLYWDQAAFKPASENPWLNPDARHPFNVGYDFNHESQATKDFVNKVMQYWLEEMRVDGFRFDLSKGFTQVNSGSNVGQWNNYDASRIAILKNYADVVWASSPGAYVILEHFAVNSEDKELSEYGAMLWAGIGVHNEYLEAAMGYSSNLSSASYQSRGWNDPHLITYMESHDEERMVYKILEFGNSSGDYNVKELPTALLRAELATAFFYTIPGPKMLWQFGELGYDFPINYCPNGQVNESCRTDNKPIRWDYFQDANRFHLYQVTAALIKLKTTYDVFNTTNFNLNVGGTSKTIHLFHSSMDVAVQGNFGVTSDAIPNPFPSTGWWYEYFSGDSLLVNDVNMNLTFDPGEYRLYTSVRLDQPDIVSSNYEVVKNEFNLQVFPNPSNGDFQINFNLEEGGTVQLEVFDLLGQRLFLETPQRLSPGAYGFPISTGLANGTYLLKLTVDQKIETQQFAVVK